MAGADLTPGNINGALATLAQRKLSVNDGAANMRQWLNRISQDADPQVVANALATASGMSAGEARKVVDAIYEISFHEASFVPSSTLDVSGPNW